MLADSNIIKPIQDNIWLQEIRKDFQFVIVNSTHIIGMGIWASRLPQCPFRPTKLKENILNTDKTQSLDAVKYLWKIYGYQIKEIYRLTNPNKKTSLIKVRLTND